MLTDSEYFWRRVYGSILVVFTFLSGAAGLYLQPMFLGVMVYLAVARERRIVVDALLFAAASGLIIFSAKYIGPAPFSDWSRIIPGFDISDILSWMFVALIAAKLVFFGGMAGCLFADVRYVRQGARS